MDEKWTLNASQAKLLADLGEGIQHDGNECFYQELIDHRLADHDDDKVILTDAGQIAAADFLRQAEGQCLDDASIALSFHGTIFYDLNIDRGHTEADGQELQEALENDAKELDTEGQA